MNILKSIGAVLAGLVFIVVTHTMTDHILETLGIFPPPEQGLHVTWMLLLATVYRTVFVIAGSYLTAALAPARPMLHAMILGAIGLTASTAAAISVIPMNLSPAWYPIALVILALPSAWAGGKLRERKGDA